MVVPGVAVVVAATLHPLHRCAGVGEPSCQDRHGATDTSPKIRDPGKVNPMEVLFIIAVAVAAAVASIRAHVARARRSSSAAAEVGRYLAEVLADARAD